MSSGGLLRFVPGLTMLSHYRRRWLRSDLIAGTVLATLLVPQGMAYAGLAGLPAVTGLYTTVACLVGYAVLGPSRILVLGPDSAVSPMILAAITPLLVSRDPAAAIALAGLLAVLIGLFEIALGLGHLGFVADLLSKEVKVGYLNGLAVVIVISQLPKLFGFSTDASGTLHEVSAFAGALNHTNLVTLGFGLGSLVLLVALPKLTRRVPAVLVVIVAATALSALLGLSARHGVHTVGPLPHGLPVPRLPFTRWSDVGPLFLAAVGITLVSLTDTIATSAGFAARRGDQVSPDQEMIAVGGANIAAGLFQGFAVSSSASRTAVAEQAGARSQLTGLIGAAIVVLLLVFFNGLLSSLPQTALAAVIIGAAWTLLDVAALRRYWRVRPSAVVVSLTATVGVVLLGVLEGILFAMGLSILLFFRSNWWPHGVVLRRSADRGWHAQEPDVGVDEIPGVVVFRWEAPLFFANAGIFARTLTSLVHEKQARWVVLQCEAITDIDVSAADALEDLDRRLNDEGVHILFVELRARLHHQLDRYGKFTTLDREHFYPSVDAALDDVRRAGPGTSV
ncbi:high affinity sulphate transporter 1 [Nakamurella panacisegetis]|uniref:High affinity sulphate transporter 1 n=1 Tax=Nakamurella panacisegetis TaxID=1090615 RepID=A0A1H0SG24_9ACTN|nr:SulP family inorganic anion transporter [Nakamurella panacisegetis]SDP40640.1 high affinity sulphate transporter 1 [Nakamurella panacisegetis]